jgi:hypothetical protein
MKRWFRELLRLEDPALYQDVEGRHEIFHPGFLPWS